MPWSPDDTTQSATCRASSEGTSPRKSACFGSATGGDAAGGDTAGGAAAGGEKSGGEKTGGEKTGGEKTGGEKTGAAKSGGEKTGGPELAEAGVAKLTTPTSLAKAGTTIPLTSPTAELTTKTGFSSSLNRLVVPSQFPRGRLATITAP